jgi:hypothetical protein
MKYDKIRKNPSRLQSLTGFNVEEFDPFLPTFRYEWYEYCSHYTLHGKLRERISCGRRSSLLPMIGDKLPVILFCLKNSLLREYHGATFGMTQPQCNEWIHLLSDILLKTLKTLEELPDRNSQRMQPVLQGIQDVPPDATERKDPYSDRRIRTGKNHVTAKKNA